MRCFDVMLIQYYDVLAAVVVVAFSFSPTNLFRSSASHRPTTVLRSESWARARVNAYHLCVCHAVCVCVNMSKLSNNSYAEIDDMKRVLGRTINNSKTACLDTFKFKSNSIIFNIGVCNCVWERSAALLNWVNEWLLLFCRRHVLMSALADCHRQEFFVILDFHSIRVEIHNN